MLADGKDEGVVYSEFEALGLGDVEVVASCVWGWVSKEEVVGGVVAAVQNGKREGEGVGIVLNGMLEEKLALTL
jgi:hypothetical protein